MNHGTCDECGEEAHLRNINPRGFADVSESTEQICPNCDPRVMEVDFDEGPDDDRVGEFR